MTATGREGSDEIRNPRGMDILKLAQAFGIHPGELEPALDAASNLLSVARKNVRPADKKALRGLAKALSKSIERVSDDAVRGRLLEANIQEPDDPDESGFAHYTAWWAARDRVNSAIEGAQDLLALLRNGEGFKIPPGRPHYRDWTIAIESILDFWIIDLRREVTISGHASDPRGVNPSPLVRFVHRCMRLIGEDISEQQCRTILQHLRDPKTLRSWMAV